MTFFSFVVVDWLLGVHLSSIVACLIAVVYLLVSFN